MTSLTFMFVCVPEPVCHTDSGNRASNSPAATRAAAAAMAPALSDRQQAELAGHLGGRRVFDPRQRAHDRDRHALRADREQPAAALGLCAPQGIARHLDRAEAVGFGPVARHAFSAGA
jgi:hypothetical protein